MFWWIALVVVVALLAMAWWLNGRHRNGAVDTAKLARTRKIDDGRGSEWGV